MLKKFMRSQKIDFLRGLAIFLMIPANFIYTFTPDSHPFWFRFCCSLAAPLFVFLSGYLVAMSNEAKPREATYYLKRVFYLFVFAVFVDVFIWQILPFHDFDVLYLLAVSAFFVYMCSRLRLAYLILIVIGIVILGQLSFTFLDFRADIDQISYRKLNIQNWVSDNSFKRFFLDGWFPLIPWLAYGIFGAVIFKLTHVVKLESKKIQLIGAVLFVLGLFATLIWKYPTEIKSGYVDLIYPPSIAFTLTIFGIMAFLFSFLPDNFGNNFFNLLGETSLFVYIFHLGIIRFIMPKLGPINDWPTFIFQSLGIILAVWIGCYILKKVTSNLHIESQFLRMLIGK